ncbi:hypothetical protein BsWGS_27119 [Bradybaena similaris]
MWKRTGNESMSPDIGTKKSRLETTGEGSSTHTESEHLFNDTESDDASTQGKLDNPLVDNDTMDVPDTLTLARQDRESQGTWEAEYSYGGEADLRQHYDDCEKNPGHKNFIPVEEFSIDNLPEGYRDSDIVEYIQAVSDLTVRVRVNYISDRRPAKFPGSNKPYLFYKYRGQQKSTNGTGYVNSVNVFSDKEGGKCKCKDCQKSSAQVTKFAIIYIHTVAHVVFDDFEAEKTTCHLSFHKGGILDSYKSGGVSDLSDMSCWWLNIEREQCELRHYTHDLDLAQGLKETQKRINKLSHQIYSKLRLTWNLKRRQPVEDKQPLLFIVSHPHGCSKQVSIGRWTGLDKMSDVYSLFWYNTATCPGSSGARICLPKWLPHGTSPVESFSFSGGHHGPSNVKRTNFCHASAEYHTELPECVTVEMLNFEGGAWEPNFSHVGEEDLCKDYDNFQKNRGHQTFIPIDKFSLDTLPPFYRKDDILEFIKIVSDLTVCVSMWCVSGERPETVPGADIPDTCDSNKVYKLLRVGSGWVTDVNIMKYQDFKNKEIKEFASIVIDTASHLAYDNPDKNPIIC